MDEGRLRSLLAGLLRAVGPRQLRGPDPQGCTGQQVGQADQQPALPAGEAVVRVTAGSFEFTLNELSQEALSLLFGGEDLRSKPVEQAVLIDTKVPWPKPAQPPRPHHDQRASSRADKLARAADRRNREHWRNVEMPRWRASVAIWEATPPEKRFMTQRIYIPRAEIQWSPS